MSGKVAIFMIAFCLAACQAKQPEAASSTTAPAPSAAASDAAAHTDNQDEPAGNAMENQNPTDGVGQSPADASGEAFLPGIKAGMAYADFRKLLLANGWTPVRTPACLENVVGGNHESVCKTNPDQITCRICELMPELDSYSGDGYALVRFENANQGKVVEATGYGMIEDWNIAGDDSRLQLTSWESPRSKAE